MIRFVYIGDQITKGGREFAFFDTVTERFASFDGESVFESVEDFKEASAGFKAFQDRFFSLIPKDYLLFEEVRKVDPKQLELPLEDV